MLEKILFVSLGVAMTANCSTTDLFTDTENDGAPCEQNCADQPDGGSGPDSYDGGTDPNDAGQEVADAGQEMTDPDAAIEVVCNVNGAEVQGDQFDNDCDGLVDELEVCSNGAYQTIGAAIAAAPSGGNIQVCAGTYAENLSVAGKDLRILGAGIGLTILDAQTLGRALAVSNSPGVGVHLEGFTVQNGRSSANGGAISCTNGALALSSVEVLNSRGLNGGGLAASACALSLLDTTFVGNTATQSGGGAYTLNSTGSVSQSEFRSNRARAGGGLTVIDGNMPIDNSQFSLNHAGLQGGGLYFRNQATISDSQFDDNQSGWTGGGIYLHQLAPTLTNIEVRDNFAVNDGGGIYTHQSSGEILNSHFSGNVSDDDGGGIRIFEGNMLVENNLVEFNEAADSGGGIRVSHLPSIFRNNQVLNNYAGGVGGGFDMDNCASQVFGGAIENNTAGGSGGGIHAWLFPWFNGGIHDVRIANNHAWQGGGIYTQHNFQTVHMSGLQVVGNTASKGAGIVVRTSNFSLANSVFTDNLATDIGGALTLGLPGRSYDEVEDVCPCPPTTTTGDVRFIVAYGNQAANGGSGLWIKAPGTTVHSSILANNTGSSVLIDGEAPTWRYNNVTPETVIGMASPTGANGNVSTPPAFVAPADGDFNLQAASSCIDAGNPSFLDMDGTTADMGRFGGLGGTL